MTVLRRDAFVAGLVFFILMFLAGDFLSVRFALPIPGSIIGLGLALCVLAVRRKVDPTLKSSSATLLRYLPVMLVPIGVGIVKLTENPPAGLFRLIVVLVLSLAIGVIGTARIMQGFLAWFNREPAVTPAPTPGSVE